MACMERGHLYAEAGQGMEQDFLLLEQPVNPRPQSTKVTSVSIREFSEENANPEPIQRDEDTDQLMEEFLSPNKLRSLTGATDLEEVTYLDMKVDTSENSLGNFGSMVPNLLQLKLNNSIISTVRDLGTSLHNLRTLWMARCGLTDLDGIGSLPSVSELYLAFNDIVDVSPLSMLDNLSVLDLEGNLVDDISQVEFLCLCTSLRSLTLEGNPVCVSPHPCELGQTPKDYDYHSAIHKAIPNLKILDDEPLLVEKVDGEDVLRQRPQQYRDSKVPQHLKTDSQLIRESIKETAEPPQDELNSTASTGRPRTAGRRPGSSRGSRGDRPGSAMASYQRPSSACHQRPSTSASGPCPNSAPGESSGVFLQDDSSDLTHGSGQVICGSISRALKERRKDLRKIKPATVPFAEQMIKEPVMRFIPEKSYDDSSVDTRTREDVFQELKKWREEYSKILNNETNILRIHDDGPPAGPSLSESAFEGRTETDHRVTRGISGDSSQGAEVFAPSPPPSRRSPSGGPSGLRRSLPTPPLLGLNRPQTTADFRVRRFRQRSTEVAVEELSPHSYHGDESFDVDKSPSTRSPIHMIADRLAEAAEPRSFSAPVKATRKFRLTPEKIGVETSTNPGSPSRPSSQPSSHSLRSLQRPITAAVIQKRRPKPPE